MRRLTLGESLAAVEEDLNRARHRALLGDVGLRPHPVQVMNLHQTKGREADSTILLLQAGEYHGSEQPPYPKLSRLLYVVLTRARERAHILVPNDVHPLWRPLVEAVIKPFKKFLENATKDGRISEWAVVWPQPVKTAGEINIPELGVDAPVITRKRRDEFARIDFIGSDAKHRAAVLPIARGETVDGLEGATGRGVVLLYLADDRPTVDGQKDGALTRDHVVPLFSLAAPSSATPHKRDLIQWTVRVPAKQDEAAVDLEKST